MNMTGKRRVAARRRQIQRALMIACAMLVIYGGLRMLLFCGNALKTRMTNDSLGRDYEQQSLPLDDVEKVEAAKTNAPPAFAATYEADSDLLRDDIQTQSEQRILDTYQLIGQDIQMRLRKLYARNTDLVGWLDIDGVLGLPVVYRNNSYYLDHDFNGKKNRAGTLFLDETHPFKAETQHLVIHGHDMVDGSMFGLLIHYRNLRYIHKHGIISFNTLFRNERYIVFAVLSTPEDMESKQYFPYTGIATFYTVDAFNDYIHRAKARSLYNIPVIVEPGDALLTLSTCLNDNRVLVMFRRVRLGEDEEQLQSMLNKSQYQTWRVSTE